jgi:argininosuccinate lyase
MQTLWKQDTPLHPTFASLNKCLEEDWFLLPHELRLQRAHAKALHEVGILSGAETAALGAALDTLEARYIGSPCPDADAEDLHTWVEAALVDAAGEAGRKIHTARSRNDQVATLLKMYVLDAGRRVAQCLTKLIGVCCRRAKDWSTLEFPLHTHNQFAAPGNVGFWVLRYATAWHRARCHLDLCASQWRRHCPLGSGAVAGSSIPIDRSLQAAELGFDGPSLNALDSTSTRDECLELLSLATQIALHLQSLAADVIIFSQTPLSWTRYPAAFGTGSSMMPNKANPDAMELLRGGGCEVAAAHHQAVLLLKGLPSGYNRDLQCMKPVVSGAVDKLLALCALAEAFMQALEFDKSRLAGSLSMGAIDATFRMERKVLEGVPLRDAHHAVAAERSATGSEDADTEGADAEGAGDGGLLSASHYATMGSANPAETRRIADELLRSIEGDDG